MAANNVSKNKQGYGYKYTDIAQIHEWLEAQGLTYYQYIERIEGDDYIYTVPVKDGKELPARRGCRVVNAELKGISNPAQEQGSAITYARRYSLLMAFGLATEDDDAASLSRPKNEAVKASNKPLKVTSDKCIDEAQIKALNKEIERTKVDINAMLDYYGITEIKQLPLVKYAGLMKSLEGMKTV